MRIVPAFMVLATLTTACSDSTHQQQSNAPPIIIGASVDQSGALASPTWTQAIQFAVDEANQGLKQAGVAGFVFQLSANDSTSTPSVAVQQAQTDVFTNGAVAMIADSSEDDIATNELNYDVDPAKRLNVPIVCTACTSSTIGSPTYVNGSDALDETTRRDPNHWNFRSTMDATLEAKVMVRLLIAQGVGGDVNGDHVFKISTYASDEAYGQGFEAAMRTALQARAPTAIMESLRHPGSADPASYDWAGGLARLTDNHTESASGTVTDVVPDAIVEMSLPQLSAAIVEAYVAGGFTTPFFHTHDVRAQAVLTELGNDLNGNQGTSHVITDGDSGAGFAQRWRSQTGLVPSFWDANAYDGAMVIMLASLVAMFDNNLVFTTPLELTGTQVRAAFAKLSDKSAESVTVVGGADGLAAAFVALGAGMPIDYAGASGPMDFDANGNVVDNIAAWNVAFAQFVDQAVYDCVGSSDCNVLVR